jgi:DNA-binding response OmpR family regulator
MSDGVQRQATILIVDDELSARETLEALLYRQGYDLRFAESGREAVEKVESEDVDVVILDVMMPEMNGFEVCEVLKGERWGHIPIILVTALDSKQDLVQGFDAGADDFLAKPVNGLELRARVRSMLRIKRQHDRLEAQRQQLEQTVKLRSELARMTARRLEELESLYQAGLRLMNSLDQVFIVEQICTMALETIPEADYCAMHLLADDQDSFVEVVMATREAGFDRYVSLGTKDLAMEAVVHKELFHVPDFAADPRYTGAELDLAQEALFGPLLVDMRCIGTLSIYSKTEHAFELAHRRLLSILANQAAVTIMKARLFESLRRGKVEPG